MAKLEQKISTDLRRTLAVDFSVLSKWNDLTPIARRDFATWVESAKQAETRTRRIGRVCSMLKAGKRRPCCYAVVPMGLYRALGNSVKAKAQWKTLTPTERRDFTDWVSSAKEVEVSKRRIVEVCSMLAVKKRRP